MKKDLKEFIDKIPNQRKQEDTKTLLKVFEKQSGFKPYLTGSIIGFGSYHYEYDSGHEGDSIITGFSPRQQKIVIYIMTGVAEYEKLLNELGKYKLGKVCIYINKLADIDIKVLEKIIHRSVKDMLKKYKRK